MLTNLDNIGMQIKAELNYLHISPRKVRLASGLLRGKNISHARAILKYMNKRSSAPLLKLLNSAVAGAKHNFNINENNLFIDSIIVNSGPVFKRSRARAFGRSAMIRKKTSHVILRLEDGSEARGSEKSSRKRSDILVREMKDLSDIKDKQSEAREARFKEEAAIKTPLKKQAGFVKRMFRRKAI